MYKTIYTNPSLLAVIESLKEPASTVETFVISNGESNAVRLMLCRGDIEVAINVDVEMSPDEKGYALDPFLTNQSRLDLTSLGLLPPNLLDALEQGSRLALALTVAHRARVLETARQFSERFARW